MKVAKEVGEVLVQLRSRNLKELHRNRTVVGANRWVLPQPIRTILDGIPRKARDVQYEHAIIDGSEACDAVAVTQGYVGGDHWEVVVQGLGTWSTIRQPSQMNVW